MLVRALFQLSHVEAYNSIGTNENAPLMASISRKDMQRRLTILEGEVGDAQTYRAYEDES
jgi:hypothetical protein